MPSHTFIKVGTFNVTLNSYSKKKKKVDSYSSKITVNDIRDKFTGNYNEYGTFSIGGQTGDGNDFVIVSKSSSYEDRINFNYPSDALNNFYGIVSGNNIIIPSQSHNGSGYDNNNNYYTFTLPYSGNGNLNGNLITISLSGIYTESGSTGINSYSFSANLTWTKQ